MAVLASDEESATSLSKASYLRSLLKDKPKQ